MSHEEMDGVLRIYGKIKGVGLTSFPSLRLVQLETVAVALHHINHRTVSH